MPHRNRMGGNFWSQSKGCGWKTPSRGYDWCSGKVPELWFTVRGGRSRGKPRPSALSHHSRGLNHWLAASTRPPIVRVALSIRLFLCTVSTSVHKILIFSSLAAGENNSELEYRNSVSSEPPSWSWGILWGIQLLAKWRRCRYEAYNPNINITTDSLFANRPRVY